MADWRQIQARIRKAKNSGDPLAQLTDLHEKTRDAMVAYELGTLAEKNGMCDDAVRWFNAAAQRFRRAQWKTKALEALARLGAPAPSESEPASAGFEPEAPAAMAQESAATSLGFGASAEARASSESASKATQPEAAPGAPGELGRKRRRRGRRGGRRRRKHREAAAGAPPPAAATALAARAPASVRAPVPAPEPEPELESRSVLSVRGRPGDPGLASRLAQLESQLRRLLASPLYRLESASEAPAGPGVFLVTDEDQTEYYYVEECQTLRIGIGNLLRAERGGSRRGGDSLKSRFAEHLGITEARVSKYMKEHCAVRWLQIDDGAPLLAHFAIAVLRPVLNT